MYVVYKSVIIFKFLQTFFFMFVCFAYMFYVQLDNISVTSWWPYDSVSASQINVQFEFYSCACYYISEISFAGLVLEGALYVSVISLLYNNCDDDNNNNMQSYIAFNCSVLCIIEYDIKILVTHWVAIVIH